MPTRLERGGHMTNPTSNRCPGITKLHRHHPLFSAARRLEHVTAPTNNIVMMTRHVATWFTEANYPSAKCKAAV
jgi:hypothetical protein